MSDALAARDLRAVLDFAGTLGEAGGLDTYRSAALELAPTLVSGDVHGYNEVPPRRGEPLVMMSEEPGADAWRDSLDRLAESHPLIVHYIATQDPAARAISDLLTRRAFVGSEFHRDVLSHVSGNDQLAVSIPGRDGVVIGLAVNRERRGFSTRDHAVYDAIRPFMLNAYRSVVAREHARVVMRALGATADAVDHPVAIVAQRDGCIAHVTPGAVELLARMGSPEGRLGDRLARWLRTQRTRSVPLPLRADGCTARIVRDAAPGHDAIVLSLDDRSLGTRALRAIGLTRREADVLSLVAAGRTNAAIGTRLGIAEATVAKHLQHVNEKLGTSSRTAAAARARDLIAASS